MCRTCYYEGYIWETCGRCGGSARVAVTCTGCYGTGYMKSYTGSRSRFRCTAYGCSSGRRYDPCSCHGMGSGRVRQLCSCGCANGGRRYCTRI